MTAPTHKAADHELQKKIFSQLDSVLSASVVDHFTHDESFPVVVVGDMFDEDLSSNTTSGQQLRARITIISEARGWKEAQELKSSIMAELDRTTFDLGSDFDHVHQKYLRSNPRRRRDSEDTMRRYIDMDFREIVTRT